MEICILILLKFQIFIFFNLIHLDVYFVEQRFLSCLTFRKSLWNKNFTFIVFCDHEILQYFTACVLVSIPRNLSLQNFRIYFFQCLKIRPFEFSFILRRFSLDLALQNFAIFLLWFYDNFLKFTIEPTSNFYNQVTTNNKIL